MEIHQEVITEVHIKASFNFRWKKMIPHYRPDNQLVSFQDFVIKYRSSLTWVVFLKFHFGTNISSWRHLLGALAVPNVTVDCQSSMHPPHYPIIEHIYLLHIFFLSIVCSSSSFILLFLSYFPCPLMPYDQVQQLPFPAFLANDM